MYKWSPGQPSIAIGDFLGAMTDELDEDVFTEFVSGDAKNYGYQTRAGKVVCKVRGFTLNVRGSAVLNFNTMKDNIRIRHFEHCHALSFPKGFRTEKNSSRSAREAIWVGF